MGGKSLPSFRRITINENTKFDEAHHMQHAIITAATETRVSNIEASIADMKSNQKWFVGINIGFSAAILGTTISILIYVMQHS